MTTTTLERASALPPAKGRAGFGGTLRSEWTKIRSVRSTFWTLFAVALVTIGISTLFAWGNSNHLDPEERVGFDAARHSEFGLLIGQLVIVVLGALAITSEYSTGMIRTSLTVQPRRLTVFAAKLLVFTGVAVVIGMICSFASYFLGQVFFGHVGLAQSLGSGDSVEVVVGAGLYLAVSGLLAFGLGAILRHTAGAITAAIGLLFVVWILTQFIPSTWAVHIDKWIPLYAGGGVWGPWAGSRRISEIPFFAPWNGFLVFTGYAALAVIVGAVLFKRRDA